MAFPLTPTNGQTTIVNGVTYQYDSTYNTWTVVATSLPNYTGNVGGVSFGATDLTVTGNINPSANLIYNLGNVSNRWGNVLASNVIVTSGVFYANGTAFGTGTGSSVYANSNVAGYLPSYAGALTASTITSSGNIVANASTPSTSATTGAIVVPNGGVGVGGNLFVGGNIVGTYTNVTITSGAYTTTLDPYGNITLPDGNLIIGNVFARTIGNTTTQLVGVGTYITGVAANALAGTANTAQVALTTQVTNSTSSGIFYPTFGNITAGNTQLWASSTNLFFQPSSGNLTAVNFNGQYYGAIITPIQTNILQVGNLNSLSVGNVSTFYGNVVVANTTAASSSTGALTVTGGINTNGIYSTGLASFANGVKTNAITSASTSVGLYNDNATANIAIGGSSSNVYVAANATVAGNLVITNLLWPNGVSYASGITQGFTNYSNSNVGGYLTTYTGNIGALYTTGGFFWAGNNLPYGYSNNAVASYLPTYSGNIRAGNITITGNLTVANIIYSNQEVISTTETVQGNLVAASGTTSTSTTTGAMVVVGGAGISGNLYVGANLVLGNTLSAVTVAGYQVINNLTNVPALQIIGNSWKGGVGYHDFLQVTNTYTGATTPTKFFRLNSTGGIEILDSTYATQIFTLDNGGNVVTPGKLTTGGGIFWSNGVSYGQSIVTAAGTYGNSNVASYLPVYNGNILASTVYSNGYFWAANGFSMIYGNGAASSYVTTSVLPNFRGNLQAGNILVTDTSGLGGNITTGNILSSGYFWANGQPFITSNYGNANVASYLPYFNGYLRSGRLQVINDANIGTDLNVGGNVTITGNLTVSNITYLNSEVVSTTEIVAGNLVANAGTSSTSTTTGALVVVGGTGISGSLFVGGSLSVVGHPTLEGVTSTGATGTGKLVFDTSPAISTPFASLQVPEMGYTSNSSYYVDNNTLNTTHAGAPFSLINWHDEFAFGKLYPTITYESYNGSAWSTGTLNKQIFAQQQWSGGTVTPADGSTTFGGRWTFTGGTYGGTSWGQGVWLVIGQSWNSGTASTKQVKVESSADGTTWTTRHLSQYSTTMANIFHRVGDYSGDQYLRVTITWVSGGAINISNMMLLSSRAGDQGYGREFMYPYSWDKDQNITSGNALTVVSTKTSTSTTTGALTVAGGISTQGNIFANAIYTTTGLYWAGNNNIISIGGGGGSPVGVSGALQYNNGGTLAAANLIYNAGNNTVIANANIRATSNVSGTMQIVGGLGVTGNVFASRVYTSDGLYWEGNGNPVSTGSLFPYLDMGFINDTTAPIPAVFDLGGVP